MAQTQSDIFAASDRARAPGRGAALYVALRASAPLEPPSRHDLVNVDVVIFGRGDRSATRFVKDGLRHLAIRIPDPMMSSDHGRLLHAHGRWLIDDPSSKNGVLLASQRVRSGALAFGDAFALGHSAFVLDRVARDAAAPLDVLATELSPPRPELATFDEAFRGTLDVLARIAHVDVSVLFLGETGTGKEVLSRALHALSGRRGAFVAVNCGGISPNLIEGELFGHKKGSFSGAVADRPGHLRAAERGTLFLDEIAELPLAAQSALLRALQQREVVPVGDSTPVAVDFRLCAATHRDLRSMVSAQTFREDLFARLMGVTVHIPPLRERIGDLGILIRALLQHHSLERARFSPSAALVMLAHRWPLNVRELERALVVAMALAGDKTIEPEHLPETIRPSSASDHAPGATTPIPAVSTLPPDEAALKQQLERLLGENDHNLAEVARKLGKDRTQIYRWVKRFGITRAARE